MAKTAIVKEILGDLEVAVHIKQPRDVGATDVPCDGLPTGVRLDESEVLCAVSVESGVVCFGVAS